MDISNACVRFLIAQAIFLVNKALIPIHKGIFLVNKAIILIVLALILTLEGIFPTLGTLILIYQGIIRFTTVRYSAFYNIFLCEKTKK